MLASGIFPEKVHTAFDHAKKNNKVHTGLQSKTHIRLTIYDQNLTCITGKSG